MNEASTQDTQTVKVTEKPGYLLREAREQQQLTVDDINKRIHLEPRIIEAIEADDYSNMPTATYTRGYLRTYAKTLGLDADHVVSLYNAENAPPPPEIIPEVKTPSQVSSSDKPVKAFTYLISLALVLLLLIWYQSNFVVDKEDTASDAVKEQQPVPDQINNTSTDFNVVIHPEGWQTPATPADEPAPEQVIDATTTKLPDTITRETNQTDAATATTLTIDESTPAILPIERNENERTYVSAGTDTIELNVSEDSWIEIYDANDDRVFMDLGKEGERLLIKGTAPFSLILGYAPGVSIKFNNETFNPEPYSNNGVARFQLPPEQ